MVKKKSSSKKKVSKTRPKKVSKLKKVTVSKRKPAKKIALKQPSKQKTVKKTKIGEITHFYDHISVAVVKLSNILKKGDTIHIEGHGKSFKQKVDSMQMEHEQIKEAKKGLEIGLKVNSRVKAKDLVFKI